jgi:tRNA A-37 threonylcarbamoyl transferase component Bud32
MREQLLEQPATSSSLLGDATPTEHELTRLVQDVLHRPAARVVAWDVEPAAYEINSPLTGGLFHVRGIASDGDWVGPWSVFVKLVRSWRHWPMLHIVPQHVRDAMLQHQGWRNEPEIYRSELAASLPDGLRLPRVLHVHDLGDERVVMWLEDVAADGVSWDLPRFERAARLLGHLTARLTAGDLFPPVVSRDIGEMTRGFYESRVRGYAFPILYNDAMWRHPIVAATVDADLRTDLLELAERVPAILARLDRLPHTLVHGDACPQNLLIPVETGTDGFVVIDWGMACNAPIGYELAQLLIGLAHSGQLSVVDLPEIHDAILGAYGEGLTEEGLTVDVEDVRYGFDAALVIRSAFTALPLERLAEPATDQLAALMADRIRLTRYLVDLGLAISSR